jgi:hypothetical protein
MFKRVTNRLAAATLTVAVLFVPSALGSWTPGSSGAQSANTSSTGHRRSGKTHHPTKKTERRGAHKPHKKAKRHPKAHKKTLAKPPRILKFFTPAPQAPATEPTGLTPSTPLLGPPADTVPPAVSGPTEQGQTLNASPGEWSENPTSYDYQWEACDSSDASCTAIAGAGDPAHELSANDVGHTIRVTVTAQNATGSAAAISAATGPISADSTTLPHNISPPTITGSPVEGQTLTAVRGKWEHNPTFTYQWQRCTSAGAGCTNMTSAKTSSYTLQASDVGHQLRVLVSAKNAAGSATAESEPVGPVQSAPAEEPPGEEQPSGNETGCIEAPHECGYPDQTNTGVPSGTTLTPRSGDIAITKPGTTIEDAQVNGPINVQANNTTIKDSEIIASGGEGEHGIWIEEGITGTVIEDDTIRGSEPSGNGVVQYAIFSDDESTRIERDYIYNATEPVSGPSQISNSLIEANGTIPEEHYEDVYYGGGGGALIVNHNTLLNPHSQTAVIFASVDFGNQTTLSITDNLMAGGGYMLYGGGSGDEGSVLGPVTVTGNRFSRHYFPEGGQYGVGAYFNESVTDWLGNFWDETLKTVPRPGD